MECTHVLVLPVLLRSVHIAQLNQSKCVSVLNSCILFCDRSNRHKSWTVDITELNQHDLHLPLQFGLTMWPFIHTARSDQFNTAAM